MLLQMALPSLHRRSSFQDKLERFLERLGSRAYLALSQAVTRVSEMYYERRHRGSARPSIIFNDVVMYPTDMASVEPAEPRGIHGGLSARVPSASSGKAALGGTPLLGSSPSERLTSAAAIEDNPAFLHPDASSHLLGPEAPNSSRSVLLRPSPSTSTRCHCSARLPLEGTGALPCSPHLQWKIGRWRSQPTGSRALALFADETRGG